MTTTVTKTIRASGGDYTTLSAWEAALPASLVSVDQVHVAECYNDWPSGLDDTVDIAGVTTDATRNIAVTVAAGHRHNGTPQSGFYIKGDSGTNLNGKFQVGVGYTVIDGLDVENTRSGTAFAGFIATATNIVVSDTISKCASSSGKAFNGNFGTNYATTRPTFLNCLAWGSAQGFSRQDSTRSRYNAYNCVAVNCATGFASGSANKAALKNCVAYGSTTIDFEAQVDAVNSDYNASSDTSANVFTNYLTGITSAAFANAAGNDFHLAATSALIGAGVNLYSTLTTDVDGDARPSSGAWDIGFDHYAASGGAAALDGSASSIATAAGTLTTAIPITGAAAVVATASGALSTAIPLAGQAASISVAGGALTTSITLSGSALSQASAGASLTTQISLSGSAVAQALASAGLTTAPQGLAGSATSQSSASGSLLTQIPLAGTASAYATGSGNLTTMTPLAGVAASVSSATGALTVEATLSGAAIAQALAAGSLTTTIRLDAAALAQAAASGILGVALTELPIHARHTMTAQARRCALSAPARANHRDAPARVLRISA